MTPDEIKARITELAARPGGMHSSDIPELDSADVSDFACGMVKKGKLIRVKMAAKRTLFFVDKKHAARAQREADLAAARKSQESVLRPSIASFSKDAEVVFTADTKFTQGPSHLPKFQAVETPHIFSANQRGRVQ